MRPTYDFTLYSIMAKQAPVVNVFSKPYEVWSRRKTSFEEAKSISANQEIAFVEALNVKDKLLEVVSTHAGAAAYMLRTRVDNGLGFFIDDALTASAEYQQLRALMPLNDPEALSSYQGTFDDEGFAEADSAINQYGISLSEGQTLFHGGLWLHRSDWFKTQRPFSTSFCPQVALRNGEWRGKAFDAGRVDLMVVHVVQPKTKAFAYSRQGDHGNEKEVVFASGAELRRVSETHVADIKAYNMTERLQRIEKTIPAYMLEIEIS